MLERKRRRCAIYTRKSTEEGLEQGFNSLDAQGDACAAYILSQTHEGWEAIGEHYDDGGWSGGNMDRPALKQLLADIAAGKIDTVVVYKVDRLTRSLADFAKIVELFDQHQVTFVSVTQAFNTTDSMGRLTLNVLLSFAQFEREVTAERIRDKVAASKKKGIWMGGTVPLGYRVADRKLHIVEDEAKIVRHIFERYCALQSVADLADELARDGYRTKERTYRTGQVIGGIPFGKGALGHMLNNPILVGRIKHKDKIYEGEHDGIVSVELWDRVQATLDANRRKKKLGTGKKDPSLLAGMLFDKEGRPISPSHTGKADRRYRYYRSSIASGEPRKGRLTVAAGEIERIVCDVIAQDLAAPISEEIAAGHFVSRLWEVEAERKRFATVLTEAPAPGKREALIAIHAKIVVENTTLSISIDEVGATEPEARKTIEVPHDIDKPGHDKAIIPAALTAAGQADPTLLKLIAHAHAAQRMLLSGKDEPTVSGFSKRHLYRLLHLSWLAPDITAAIVEGRHPRHLNARKLLRTNGIPLEWEAQRQMLGFH